MPTVRDKYILVHMIPFFDRVDRFGGFQLIKNEHQFRVTRKLLCELESSLSSVYSDKQFAELPAKAKSEVAPRFQASS